MAHWVNVKRSGGILPGFGGFRRIWVLLNSHCSIDMCSRKPGHLWHYQIGTFYTGLKCLQPNIVSVDLCQDKINCSTALHGLLFVTQFHHLTVTWSMMRTTHSVFIPILRMLYGGCFASSLCKIGYVQGTFFLSVFCESINLYQHFRFFWVAIFKKTWTHKNHCRILAVIYFMCTIYTTTKPFQAFFMFHWLHRYHHLQIWL